MRFLPLLHVVEKPKNETVNSHNAPITVDCHRRPLRQSAGSAIIFVFSPDDIMLWQEQSSLTYRRASSRRAGRHIGRDALRRVRHGRAVSMKPPSSDGVRQKTAARTGVRQRQDVRNQRKVAF